MLLVRSVIPDGMWVNRGLGAAQPGAAQPIAA